MVEQAAIEPLTLSVTVACSPQRAFELWTTRASTWWPRDHSVSGDPQLDVVFEPRVGGRIYERTSTLEEHDWGEITTWEPPGRLVYEWHIASDRSDATEVEVRFDAHDGGTLVSIEHRGWERLGAKAPARREANHWGWSDVLRYYTEAGNEGV